jgi:FAD/FMN-containing dehydrogenase
VRASVGDFSELSIDGRVATPSNADWDEARQAWNLVADQHPSAVALVESAADIANVVRFAGERGLKVAARGTGHGAAALGTLDDTILVKTERMRGVEIDAEASSYRTLSPGCAR